MRRLVRIVLPILILAVIFGGLYLATEPQNTLPDFAEVQLALGTLENYGYESRQIVGKTNFWRLGLCFAGFVFAAIGYFWLYDYMEKRKILKVIDYTRKINDKIYDLKLDENNEGELSLLTNELYKTTVLLQEAAEADKRRTKHMEAALADISHQLRTPLTSLQITLDNLSDNPDLDVATRQDFLRASGRQVEQMSALVVTLLNLAKLDNSALRMQPRPTKVSYLLDEAISGLAVLAEVSGVTINVSGDVQAKVRVDAKWQVQALLNIIKNCIEHSVSGQTVDITVVTNAVYTRIVVADAGEGIPAADLRHIFERFYKAKNARPESVGIGLAFAKALIEADGGQVKVKSKEGVGTTYEVTYY